jgi:hypothetical protein
VEIREDAVRVMDDPDLIWELAQLRRHWPDRVPAAVAGV